MVKSIRICEMIELENGSNFFFIFAQILKGLEGLPGRPGKNGTDGFDGFDGAPGENAYLFEQGGIRGDEGFDGQK